MCVVSALGRGCKTGSFACFALLISIALRPLPHLLGEQANLLELPSWEAAEDQGIAAWLTLVSQLLALPEVRLKTAVVDGGLARRGSHLAFSSRGVAVVGLCERRQEAFRFNLRVLHFWGTHYPRAVKGVACYNSASHPACARVSVAHALYFLTSHQLPHQSLNITNARGVPGVLCCPLREPSTSFWGTDSQQSICWLSNPPAHLGHCIQ